MTEAAIDALSAVLAEAFKNQDAELVAQNYTEDCQLLTPGYDAVFGREAFKKICEEKLFDKGVKKLEMERISFIDAGDYAIETANWTSYGEGDTILHEAKYTGVYRKDPDGKWRVHIDCSNPRRP